MDDPLCVCVLGALPHRAGVLLKWVNYMKGFQPRYFVLDKGTLAYHRYAAETETERDRERQRETERGTERGRGGEGERDGGRDTRWDGTMAAG
jgi:hypothetical protein